MRFLKVLKKIVLFILLWALTNAIVLPAALFITVKINDRLNESVTVKRYTYSDPDLPSGFDGYRILVISDLHDAPFSDQIIDLIRKQDPNVVVMTGDMSQLPEWSVQESAKIGKAVGGEYPIYAVSGNHERQGDGYEEILASWKWHNIVALENDTARLECGNDSILLIGLKDPKQEPVSEGRLEEMRAFVRGSLPEEKTFSILLNHRAGLYPELKDTGVDLILSGDLHGGIVRLPFVGGLFGKDFEMYPSYAYGYVKEGDSAAMIVSGGCDKNPKKKRFLNQPELVLITLKCS